jgi:hypothetical protein
MAYWNGTATSLILLAVRNSSHILLFAFSDGIFLFLLAIGLCSALWGAGKNSRDQRILALALAPMLVIFIAACLRLYPYYGGRQLIFLTPMLYVVAGSGFDYFWRLDGFDRRSLKAAVMAVLVLVVGLVGLYDTAKYLSDPGDQNIKPVVEQLELDYAEGDIIYIERGAYPAFHYYYHGNARDLIVGGGAHSDTDTHSEFTAALQGTERIWMVFSHIQDGDRSRILAHAANHSNVILYKEDKQAWLYLAE